MPRKRLLLVVAIALALAMTVVVVYWPRPGAPSDKIGNASSPSTGDKTGTNPETPPAERLSVLVIGTDDRPGDPGRTDTIILTTVDTGTGEVHLFSIPRDTWVYIENYGWDKINHAYAVAADDDERPQTVVRTVSDLLGVPIDHYVVVHMEGFQTIVDLLGGIDLYIEQDMYYEDPLDTPPLIIDFKQGHHRLTGEEALKYVRFRGDHNYDWGRMQRQQQFIKALAKEAMQPKHILRAGSLAKAIKAAVDTDLGVEDLLRLSLSYKKFNLDEMKTQTLGGFDRWIGGIYFLEPNLMHARELAYRQVMGKEPPENVLIQANADFEAARQIIVSEIARFEAMMAEAETGDEAEEEAELTDPIEGDQLEDELADDGDAPTDADDETEKPPGDDTDGDVATGDLSE